jgi:hypothetical protein
MLLWSWTLVVAHFEPEMQKNPWRLKCAFKLNYQTYWRTMSQIWPTTLCAFSDIFSRPWALVMYAIIVVTVRWLSLKAINGKMMCEWKKFRLHMSIKPEWSLEIFVIWKELGQDVGFCSKLNVQQTMTRQSTALRQALKATCQT